MEKYKLWMIVIIAILVLMCTGFVVGFLMLKSTIGSLQQGEASANVAQEEADTGQLSVNDYTTYTLADDIRANLLPGEDGKPHIVVVRMGVGILNGDTKAYDEFLEVFEANETVVRDVVGSILRGKTQDELKSIDGADMVKAEVLEKLQEKFQSNLIVEIFMGEYIVQ